MSVHTEWVRASDARIEVVGAGEHHDDHDNTNNGPAVVISGSDVVVIEGSLQELQEFADRISREVTLAVEALAEPATKRVRFIIEADVPKAYGDDELGTLLSTAATQIVEPIIGWTEDGAGNEIQGETSNIDSRLEVLEVDETAYYFSLITEENRYGLENLLYEGSVVHSSSAVGEDGRGHFVIKTVAGSRHAARQWAEASHAALAHLDFVYDISDIDSDLELVVTVHSEKWGVDLRDSLDS